MKDAKILTAADTARLARVADRLRDVASVLVDIAGTKPIVPAKTQAQATRRRDKKRKPKLNADGTPVVKPTKASKGGKRYKFPLDPPTAAAPTGATEAQPAPEVAAAG